MKKLLAIAAAAAIMATAGTAMAVNTADLSVTATVSNVCSVSSIGSMSFPALDPTNPVQVTATTTMGVTCTNGMAYNVKTGTGLHSSGTQANLQMGSSSADRIPYSVSGPTGGGTGSGALQSLTLTGTIAANTYNTASTGTYTDTMVITVEP